MIQNRLSKKCVFNLAHHFESCNSKAQTLCQASGSFSMLRHSVPEFTASSAQGPAGLWITVAFEGFQKKMQSQTYSTK